MYYRLSVTGDKIVAVNNRNYLHCFDYTNNCSNLFSYGLTTYFISYRTTFDMKTVKEESLYDEKNRNNYAKIKANYLRKKKYFFQSY